MPSSADVAVEPLTLDQIKMRRDRAETTLRKEAHALDDFVLTSGDRTILSLDSSRGTDSAKDATDDASPTAFAIALLLGGEGPYPNLQLGKQLIPKLDDICRDAIADYLTIYKDGGGQGKEAAPLPNAYNTPLYLWSLATIVRAGTVPLDDRDTVIAVGESFAASVAGWLNNGFGRILSLDKADNRVANKESRMLASLRDYGRPYLTYLCTRALIAWRQVEQRTAEPSIVESETRALEIVQARADAELARDVAAYGAGVQSLFDSVDIVCCQSILALTSDHLGRTRAHRGSPRGQPRYDRRDRRTRHGLGGDEHIHRNEDPC